MFREGLNLGRRLNHRIAVRGQATIICHNGQTFRGHLINFATGGLFLMTPNVLLAGTAVEVKFELESFKQKFQCKAYVAWENGQLNNNKRQFFPQGIALQFIELSPALRRLFSQYVTTSRSLTGLDTRIGGEVKLNRG